MNTLHRAKSFCSFKSLATNDTSIDDSSKKPSRVSQFQQLNQLNRTMSAPSTPRNKSLNNIATLNRYAKTPDELRFEFYSKLIHHHIWNPNQTKTKLTNTLIFFDWDDTLLCTSLLVSKNSTSLSRNDFTAKELARIKQLESKVMSLLNKAVCKGDTYIITNSQPGWVEHTAKTFYPRLTDAVINKGLVRIISARGLYEQFFPNDIRMWKICAFECILMNYNADLVTNVVSVGDSFLEVEAGKLLAKGLKFNVVKTVQFSRYDKIEELAFQVELVCERFEYIVSSAKNWTINVSKTRNNK